MDIVWRSAKVRFNRFVIFGWNHVQLCPCWPPQDTSHVRWMDCAFVTFVEFHTIRRIDRNYHYWQYSGDSDCDSKTDQTRQTRCSPVTPVHPNSVFLLMCILYMYFYHLSTCFMTNEDNSSGAQMCRKCYSLYVHVLLFTRFVHVSMIVLCQ